MKELVNTLPPKYSTWLAFYESIDALQLEGISSLAEVDRDKSIVEILIVAEHYSTEPGLYSCTLGHIKKRAFEELYEELPTKEQRHNARKRAYMGMGFNPTAGQNLLDFINTIPVKQNAK